jgi:hypothetical protein
MTAARYPADRELKRLIAELTSHSPVFVGLWESGEIGSPRTGPGTRSSTTPTSDGSHSPSSSARRRSSTRA